MGEGQNPQVMFRTVLLYVLSSSQCPHTYVVGETRAQTREFGAED